MKNKLISVLVLVAMISSCLGGFTAMAEEDSVNVALYQTATASSAAGANCEAKFANDGINDNEDYTYWMSDDADEAAYWMVDLGLPHKIAKIELEARKGADPSERTNIRVMASTITDFGYAAELGSAEEDYGDKLVIDVTKKVRYRYIRVEKLDGTPISIGELRVFAEKDAIAQGMEAVSTNDQIPASDEAGRYTVPADVVGTPYEDAVSLLGALNIMRGYPDGDFLPNEPITRGEFAAVAMRLMDYSSKATSRTFEDVTTDHWAYNEIEGAAAFKIVNGVGEGKFKPDDVITANQVIKMLVCVLGYGETAEMLGGYPGGYVQIATKLGLIKGVSIADGENITRGEISLLVENALDCDVMVVTSIGENISGTAVKGETLLTEYLNTYKAEGVVTAAGNSSLTAVVDDTDTNSIEVEGIRYVTDIPDAYKYLGYNVDCYYKEDPASGRNKAVAVVINDTNNVTTIDAENLVKIDGSRLTYLTENDNDKTLTLETNMDLVYNGVARKIYDKNTDLIPESGSVTLIDNDGNRTIDVYIVNKVDNYSVNWVNVSDEKIYVKNSSKILDLDSQENTVSIISKKTGKAMTLSEIAEWNTISVRESVNDSGVKHYHIVVSADMVRGSLEEISEDDVVIEGTPYKVAANFDISALNLGSKGVFYLDAENKIAAFDGDINPGEQYGFLRDVGNNRQDLKDRLALRIFTKDGIFKTLYVTDQFVIDDVPCATADKAKALLIKNGMNDTVAQAVRFSVNGKGEVTELITVAGDLSKDYDAEAGTPAPIDEDGYYLSDSGVFDASFSMDTETVIVELPKTDISEEKDYKLLSAAGIAPGKSYSAQVFDAGEESIAKMIVFTGGASRGASTSRTFFLVDRIVKAINEDGEDAWRVSGLYQGEMVSYFIDSDLDVDAADFRQGTVLTLSFAGDVIDDYEIKFYEGSKPADAPAASVSTETPQYGETSRGYLGICWYGYGTVETKKNGIARVSFANSDIPNPGSAEDFVNYSDMLVNLSSIYTVYRYDSENKKIEIANSNYALDRATVGDEEASKILISADSANVNEMIIFD